MTFHFSSTVFIAKVDFEFAVDDPALRIEMPDEVGQHTNLQTAVDKHLEQKETVACPNCQKRLTKTSTKKVVDPKPALVVFLNRIQDNPMSKTEAWKTMDRLEKRKYLPVKSNTEIGISHMLTLPLLDGTSVLYELVGTIEHFGNEPFGGHYVSNLWDKNDSIWYTANDSEPLKKSESYEEFDVRRSAVFLYSRV